MLYYEMVGAQSALKHSKDVLDLVTHSKHCQSCVYSSDVTSRTITLVIHYYHVLKTYSQWWHNNRRMRKKKKRNGELLKTY